MAALKVYGWTGWADRHLEIEGRTHPTQQVRCVMAASSKAEIERILDVKFPRAGDAGSLGETWNEEEIEVAIAQPRTLFVHALHGRGAWLEAPNGKAN